MCWLGLSHQRPLPPACEFFLTNVITLRAPDCTPADVALAAANATKTPTILVFSEVDTATFDVAVRIMELVESGFWRSSELPPWVTDAGGAEYHAWGWTDGGLGQFRIKRINKGSTVLKVPGAVTHV